MKNDIQVLSSAPVLEDGDVIVVQKVSVRGITWRDLLTLSGFALTLASFFINLNR